MCVCVCVCTCVYVCVFIYLPTPPLGQDMTLGQFLSLTGLNSEFSFSYTSSEFSLPYYLPIAGGRIISHNTYTHQATSSSTPRFMEGMDL